MDPLSTVRQAVVGNGPTDQDLRAAVQALAGKDLGDLIDPQHAESLLTLAAAALALGNVEGAPPATGLVAALTNPTLLSPTVLADNLAHAIRDALNNGGVEPDNFNYPAGILWLDQSLPHAGSVSYRGESGQIGWYVKDGVATLRFLLDYPLIARLQGEPVKVYPCGNDVTERVKAEFADMATALSDALHGTGLFGQVTVEATKSGGYDGHPWLECHATLS